MWIGHRKEIQSGASFWNQRKIAKPNQIGITIDTRVTTALRIYREHIGAATEFRGEKYIHHSIVLVY